MVRYESDATYKLIETGSLVTFNITKQDIYIEPDGIGSHVNVELQMIDENGHPEESVVKWGSFGFMFLLAALSFDDARPRGMSEKDYVEGDSFTLNDFFDCLKFYNGELYLYADYISGRCMKTHISVQKNGTVTIATRNRGKALIYWLDRLQGKKKLELLKTE